MKAAMSSPKSPLSLSQIAASALAASSAAFAASYLGVAGTIIGAAVASVIATVAGAMYGASLERSSEAVRRRALPARTLSTARPALAGEPTADLIETRVLQIAPEPLRADRPRARFGRMAVAAAAVLAVTLGSLTGLEAILGRPVSALLGGSATTGTSIGSAVTGKSGARAKTPSAPTTPAEVTPAPTPTPTPTDVPTGVPTSGPTTAPTPTGSPTTSPTGTPTDVPTSTPTAAQ